LQFKVDQRDVKDMNYKADAVRISYKNLLFGKGEGEAQDQTTFTH